MSTEKFGSLDLRDGGLTRILLEPDKLNRECVVPTQLLVASG